VSHKDEIFVVCLSIDWSDLSEMRCNNPSLPLEEKVPDRADEEVVQSILITSSSRPSPPKEERVACRLASSSILSEFPKTADHRNNYLKNTTLH
jgi:hypothetical protein